eukprot:349907-Chlamydomonas_euryale.AAC.5
MRIACRPCPDSWPRNCSWPASTGRHAMQKLHGSCPSMWRTREAHLMLPAAAAAACAAAGAAGASLTSALAAAM